jgi:recombinational DNA repair protein RecT
MNQGNNSGYPNSRGPNQQQQRSSAPPPAPQQSRPPAQAVQKRPEVDPFAEFEKDIERLTLEMVQAMPFSVPAEQFARAQAKMKLAFTNTRASLVECTPQSVGRCVALSALSGLYPGGHNPDVDIIPRKNKDLGNVVEANWQISWRGYKRLARRNGYEVEPVLVYQGDVYKITRGSTTTVTHEPAPLGSVERGWATMLGGYVKVYPVGREDLARFEDLTKAQIAKRRAKAQSDVFWSGWTDEMALKTLCRYAGQRELFPCDDQTRFLIKQDIEMDPDADVGVTLAHLKRPAIQPQAFLPQGAAPAVVYVNAPQQRGQEPVEDAQPEARQEPQQHAQAKPKQEESAPQSEAASEAAERQSGDYPAPPQRFDEKAAGTIPRQHATNLRAWAKDCGLDQAALGKVLTGAGLNAQVELLKPDQQAQFEAAVIDHLQAP